MMIIIFWEMIIIILLSFLGWGETESTWHVGQLAELLYQPQMIDEYREFCGMRIGRGNRSTRRKPAPAPWWEAGD
jgi:hypothetical protein